MITIAIFGETHARAQKLAEALRPSGHFEIAEAHVSSAGLLPFHSVEVIVADHIHAQDLPVNGPPIVLIAADGEVEARLPDGVRAYLPPDVTPAELSAAITAVAVDLTVLTDTQAKQWLRRAPAPEGEGAGKVIEALTARELQVLHMLADGLGNKEIASGLRISEHTAKFHVAQILAKLGAASRARAVTIGIRRGLVPI